ncbi:MAG: hypothetical protein A2X52_22440 [Candidatus Rokubacteria bacterium GWC2_70_16]|nr:MAG: hypothetical protein A2X52_22440 [Candidatus Rokubacteria bacterium GWC2_70_16]
MVRLFSMTSEPAELARLRQWLRPALAAEGLPREECAALLLAVGELCANAIRHSYEGRGGQPIEVSLEASEEGIVLHVEDWGKPFDPAQYAPPDLDALPEGGVGLYLVQRIADRLSWETERGRGTRWTLLKYRPGRAAPAAGT